MARIAVRADRRQSRKPTTAPGSESRQREGPGLDAAALADIVEELRVIDHTLSCAAPLAEEARVVVNATECDEPARRDPIAKISLRLQGVDVDRIGTRSLRPLNDPLIEAIVDAADAVIEAARWRLDRVRCVLMCCAESQQVNKSTSQQ
jgi:hypothetical protein